MRAHRLGTAFVALWLSSGLLTPGALGAAVPSEPRGSTVARDWSAVSANVLAEVERAVSVYGNGEAKAAIRLVQKTYFDVFEASGMEAKVGAKDADFKARLEADFTMLMGCMRRGASSDEIQATLTSMKTDFEKALAILGTGADPPTALFVYSLTIIVREGIEAILIVTAIIAYLLKTGHREKLRTIYNGCISAMLMSAVTAFLVKWVLQTSAASQEVLEGVTMLVASVVLFSVSYWLLSKAEAQKWVSYIQGRVAGSLSGGSLKALWFAAFLAVYREGAETVLFYQALISGSTAAGLTAIAGGFLAGCSVLVLSYLGMRYGAVRLPIRPFFLLTGGLLYSMAFVFAGKGVMELIEGKLFEPALVSWAPAVPWIGLYPYVQTLVPQLLITAAAAAALALMARRRVRQAAYHGCKRPSSIRKMRSAMSWMRLS